MSKCRHKKTILASANLVDFRPDQEPFESGKIECAGVSEIRIGSIWIHYCPKCDTVIDIELEQGTHITTTTCTSDDRCDGHE